MKSSLSIQQLAAEITRQAEAREDYISDTRLMSVVTEAPGEGATETVLMLDPPENEEAIAVVINDHAHGQIADRIGVPKKYYDRMRSEAPELLDRNINHWLHNKPERRMIRTLDGRARAFLSDRYRRLDNDDLALTVLPILARDNETEIVSCALTEKRLYIKAMFPRIIAEVKVGETVRAGVCISNSEIGSGSLAIEVMIEKLVCKNGMIVATALRRHHVGRRVEESEDAFRIFKDETLRADDEAFFLKVRDLVMASADEARFIAIVEQCRELTGMHVEEAPPAAIERLGKRFDLGEGEQASILQHLILGADLSAWGYVNAVTRASQDVEDYDRATELERLGGEMLAEPAWVAA